MNHPFFDAASYDFSAYSIPVAVTGIMSLALGVATLIRERRSGASIAFMVMQAAVASWLLTYAVINSTTNEPTVRVWLHVMAQGLVWIPVAVLAFAIAVSEQWRRLWPVVGVAAVVSAVFAFAGLAYASYFTKEVREFFWGYYPIAGPGTTFYALYQTACLLGAAYILWAAQRKTHSVIRGRRIRALLVALMISYLSGIDFLPTSGVEVYPFGFVFIGVFVVLGTRAIWRYRLVDLTPELAAPQIIETMSEALLVADPDGVIRVANGAAVEMFGGDRLVGSTLSEVTARRVERIIGVSDSDDVNQMEFSYEDDGTERTVVIASRSLVSGAGDLIGTIHIGHDITERKQAEQALGRSESLYRTLFETSPDAVILTDRTGVIQTANQEAAQLLRTSTPENLAGKPAVDFIAPEDRERVGESLRAIAESQVLRSDEFSLVAADGRVVPIELTLSRIRDTEGEVDGFLAIARDISERKRAAATIQHLAYHDPLTGLANRALLLQRLSDSMAQADEAGLQVAVLYLDLDGMKTVNDTYGHPVGDNVLRQVGGRLSGIVRGEDSLARIGGDEFVIVIPGVSGPAQVTAIAERILTAIREPFALNEGACELSVSIGISTYPASAATIEGLLSGADAAMYEAKAHGGNHYEYAKADTDLARAV